MNHEPTMDLTHTAEFTKRLIIFSIIILVLSIVGFVSFKLYQAYEIAHRPKVEEKPNFEYGELPNPELPPSLEPSSDFTYSIDTQTGELTPLAKVMKVYIMPKSFSTLLATQKSEALAKKFEIESEPQILNEILYRYGQEDRTINISLDTLNFSYSRGSLEDKVKTESLDNDAELISKFKDFLASQNLLKDTLKNGNHKIQLLKFNENNQPMDSPREEATGAQISIWPEPILEGDEKTGTKIPILTPDPNKGLINAIVYAKSGDLKYYYSLNYTFWPIDTKDFATYPIKTSEEAFEELKTGLASIVTKPSTQEVSISTIYLAYYQPTDYTPYLLPIIVFEGPDFQAYLPAIKSTNPESDSAPSPSP